jgi:hypothetical protein
MKYTSAGSNQFEAYVGDSLVPSVLVGSSVKNKVAGRVVSVHYTQRLLRLMDYYQEDMLLRSHLMSTVMIATSLPSSAV